MSTQKTELRDELEVDKIRAEIRQLFADAEHKRTLKQTEPWKTWALILGAWAAAFTALGAYLAK